MAGKPGILDRLIEPQHGNFSAEHARYVLGLDFSPDQHARYADLSAIAEKGTLSQSEQAELDEFLAANCLLMILQSKARLSLKKHSSAA